MHSGSHSFHPNDFSKTVLSWTFETLARPLDLAVRQAPLPRSEQSIARYYANFLPFILEESRSIIASGLEKVEHYNQQLSRRGQNNGSQFSEAKPFNLVLKKKAHLPKNEGNPLSMTFRGAIPDKIEHGKSMIVLLLKTKNITPAKQFIALATENQNATELFVKMIISSEDHYAYGVCFEDLREWEAHYLGSVISEQRMYDACLDATDISCVQQIARSQIQTPRIGRNSIDPEEMAHLNLSQQQAIYAFFNAREGSTILLQGPPGTGKTTTLVSLIKQAVSQGKRTLVSAHSNKAVQVLALRAFDEVPDVPMILVGVESKLPEKLKPLFLDRWYDNILIHLSFYYEEIETLAQAPASVTSIPISDLIAQLISGLDFVQQTLTKFDLLYYNRLPEESRQAIFALTNDPLTMSDFQNAQRVINELKTQQRSKNHWKALLDVQTRLMDKWRQLKVKEEDLKVYLLDYAVIVFSTLVASARKNMLRMAPVDFLLVDEAAQSVEAATLIPMRFQPSKVLLVGDTKQLPATVISSALDGSDQSIRRQPSNYPWSMMWRLIEENRQPSIMLTIQYRMHPYICQWPSGQYYEDRLITAPDILPMPLLSNTGILSRPYAIYQVSGQVESRDGSHSVCNPKEAECVIKIIEHIRRQNTQCSIGVITPYVAQKQLINTSLLRKRHLLPLVDVNTVDGFQGDERDVIIISFTRTHVSEFLKEFRRLNVAITRPKACLIILGAPTLLSNDIGVLMTDAQLRKVLHSEQDLNRILTTGALPDLNQALPAPNFHSSAWQGNPDHQFQYAKQMEATDNAMAFVWHRRAAENNHPEAQYHISQVYILGNAVITKDVQLGLKWLNKAVNQALPLPMAQHYLGQHFISGTVIVKNIASGIYWCNRAADAGLIDAIIFLAKCYEEGTEVPQNNTQAQNYYRKAARLDDLPSMIKLAGLLVKGTQDNQREALKWYKKAGEKNRLEAYYPLATLNHLLNNQAEALKWYEKAAESGHQEAQYELGLRYKHGYHQCPIDPFKSAKFFKMAAIAGNTEAQFIYAACAKEGNGVEQNNAEAMRFFQRAADNGHLESQYQYALLMTQQASREAHNEAYTYYLKAARQNHSLAQYACIPHQIESGSDLAICLHFCDQLALQGNPDILFILARLLDTGIAGKTDKAQAYRYYLQLANNHHMLAHYYCAVTLEEGVGVNRDCVAALDHYEACLEQCIEAKLRLARLLLQGQDYETHEIRAVELLNFYYTNINSQHENTAALPVTLEQYTERLITANHAINNRTNRTACILDSVDTPSSYANYSFAILFKEGNGVAQNTEKAMSFFKKAADREHTESCYQLALLKSKILPTDAYPYFKKAALKNHMLAQYESIRYQLKYNHDLPSCLVFCEQLKIVMPDNYHLLFVLARLLDTGIAGKTDKTKAYNYYSQLAIQNHIMAQYYAAIILEEGVVVQRNVEMARQYYEFSSIHCIEAKLRLACFLLESTDNNPTTRVQYDTDLDEIEREGSSCMPRRKEGGRSSHTNRNTVLTKDQTKAIELLSFYCDHYQDDSVLLLPDALEQNVERLILARPNNHSSYTIRATNTYPAQANYFIGKIFQEGKGVEINNQRALQHYRLASSENSDASYRIGYMYESGRGVPKNWTTAKGFYQGAADRGHELAAKRLTWSYSFFSWGSVPNDETLRQTEASQCLLS